MNRLNRLSSAILLILWTATNSIAGENKQSPESKIAACTTCHNKVVSLKGRGVDNIIKQTKAIRDKNRPHPPAGIKKLNDQDVEAIAQLLDKE